MALVAKTEVAGQVIAATDSAFAELEALLESAEAVTLHGDDEHEWSAADVWGHLGRWLLASGDVVRRYQAGERAIDDYDNGEALNLDWLAKDAGLSLEAARTRALGAWAELRTLLADVAADDWNGLFEGYARGTGYGHVLEHIGFIVQASGVEARAEGLERLQRDREAWTAFVALLDARPGVPLHDPESPTWTSLEVFGHFAHWTEHEVATFEAELDGRERPVIDEPDDVVNERWAAEDRASDLETARGRALRAFARRAALIASTPADEWTEAMRASIAAEGYDHISEHRRYLVAG